MQELNLNHPLGHHAGVDEAGRGPLAGPVVAAAVILDPKQPITGLRDSKKLTARQREYLFHEISERCIDYGVGRASPKEIDTLNILQASLLAMQRAVQQLRVSPVKIWIDGPHAPTFDILTEAVIRGDAKIAMISAASIMAKVTRDQEMCRYDEQYPGYGFAQHKGYPTRLHRLAIKKLGYTAIHRQSFKVNISIPLQDAKHTLEVTHRDGDA